MKRLNRTGSMGMLTVLAMATAAGFLVVALTQSLDFSAKRQRGQQAKSEWNALVEQIDFVIRDPKLCKTAFLNSQTPAKAAYFDPDDPSLAANKQVHSVVMGGATVAALGKVVVGGVTTNQLALSEISSTARVNDGVTITYAAKFSISADRSYFLAAPEFQRDFSIYVQTDASTHQIKSCGATNGAPTLAMPTVPTPTSLTPIAWEASGMATTGFYNGTPQSVPTAVTFPQPCPSGKAVILTQSYSDSVLCGTGGGPTTCLNDPNSSSTDVKASIGNVSTTGFKVWLSAMNNVWVGSVSPAFQISYNVKCLN